MALLNQYIYILFKQKEERKDKQTRSFGEMLNNSIFNKNSFQFYNSEFSINGYVCSMEKFSYKK